MTRRTLVGGGVRVPSRRSCSWCVCRPQASGPFVPGTRSHRGSAMGRRRRGTRERAPRPVIESIVKTGYSTFLEVYLPQVLAKHVRCKRGACSTITVSRSVPQEWQTRQGARIVHHAQALIAADILLPTSAAGSPSTSKLFSTPNSVLEQRTQ